MREYSFAEILEGVLIETSKQVCVDLNDVTPVG